MVDSVTVQHETICHACTKPISATVLITHQAQEHTFSCLCGYVNKFRYWIINSQQKD